MYALVENNQIIQVVESLPTGWRNISGLNLITDILTLKNLGWHQVIFDEPIYNIETETIFGYEYIYNQQTNSVHRKAIIGSTHIPTEEELIQQLLQKRQRMICTNYQARAVLIQLNLYSAVENIMSDPQTDPMAKIAWEYASNFYRISPFVNSMASVLNLTDEQLDDLFEQAMAVTI